MKLCALLAALCSSLLLPAIGLGQHYPMLPVANSPHGIFTMFEDSKSRLWLGTIDDVYCFDGVNFYSLRQFHYPQETADAFGEDSGGGIWIATQGTAYAGGTRHGGLYLFQAGHLDRILSGDGLSIVKLDKDLLLASMGTEASGKPTYGDLYRLRLWKGRWKADLLAPSFANHLTIDHQGNALFPCPGGWCELSQQQSASAPAATCARSSASILAIRWLKGSYAIGQAASGSARKSAQRINVRAKAKRRHYLPPFRGSILPPIWKKLRTDLFS